VTKAGTQLRGVGVAKAVHRGDAGVRTPGEGSLSGEEGSAVDARRVDDGSLHNSGFVTRAGAQLKSTGVAEAVRKDKTRVRTPGEGSLSGGGGGAVDARRVDDGSLHSGGSVTKAGTQLRGVGVAKAVHRGDAGVRTPGEGSLSGEEGSAVDARRVDDGSLHNSGFVTRAGAQLKSTGVAEAVRKDKTRVRTPGEGSLSGGGGGAVDARRVDDGSLHIGGSVTKAGTQLRGVGVAKAVHRGDAGVGTPGEGSLSGEDVGTHVPFNVL
jgi:hypothetical protein